MSGACCARRNSAREFQGHGWSAPFKSNVGNLAPRFETKFTSLGKLSSNGPRRPLGYQMKWPMPSEAKSSPSFHAVRPVMVPLHSFCQILFPILRTSECERLIAQSSWGQVAIDTARSSASSEREPPNRPRRCFLDGRRLSTSVPLPAAINRIKLARKIPSYETSYPHFQRILTCIALVW